MTSNLIVKDPSGNSAHTQICYGLILKENRTGLRLNEDEIAMNTALIPILLEAIHKDHQTIQMIKNPVGKRLCVLKRQDYEHILYEITLLVRSFDQLIKKYDQDDIKQDMNMSSNETEISVGIGSEISLGLLPQRIREFQRSYEDNQRQKVINHQSLSHKQIEHLDHLVKSCPYRWILLQPSVVVIDYQSYLNLCLAIQDLSYVKDFPVKSESYPNHNVIYFDHNFYLTMYPCFKSVLKTPEDSYGHFITHGLNENRLPNAVFFRLKKESQKFLLKSYLLSLEIQLHDTKDTKDTNGVVPIYVLTRTCDREKLFGQCVQSLFEQKDPNLRHIVSYDTTETAHYLEGYPHIAHQLDLRTERGHLRPNQYIDCFYDYLQSQEPGWVLVLDDDDKFMTPHAIRYLRRFLFDPQCLIIWMLYRPDQFIYPKIQSNPKVGEIGSCCYMYHT